MKKLLSLAAAALALSAASVMPSATADADDAGFLMSCSFESGDDGWSGRGGAIIETSNNVCFDGNSALYCSNRSDSWNGAAIELGNGFNAGETYSFSANVRYDSGKDTSLYHFTMQYNNGSETNYTKIASATIIKGKWAQLANPKFTIPANASDISVYIETAKGTGDFFVDDVKIAAEGTAIDGAKGGKYIPGDLCEDGVVDTFDLICARKLIVSPDKEAEASVNADVDKSTEYAVNDLVLLDGFISGKISEFPDNAPKAEVTPFEYEANKQFKEAPGNYFNSCELQGKVTKESYNGIRGNKSLYVYTPYNYDPEKKYNIFYLMHGGGENENTLFFQDDTMIQNMLDHMIMNGELEPLIVVTPTFNGTGSEAGNFYEEFRKSVVPFVEGKYSTYAESTSPEDLEASRMHRAYGGFSMGSVSTWAVMQNDLDIVGYLMPLSGDHWQGEGAYGKARSLADAVDRFGYTNRQFFVFAATGSDDIAYPNVNPQVDEMKKMPQFKFTSDFSDGNFYFMVAPGKTHWWGYVRHYVYDALPYFFHETGE
ncbi:MAG: carbohydrate binding domain-containing protein [Ruminococcus sp.]|nr:carbohydrate binding domain-containing protein [Ruminococcus sp.]